jgi:hypothetical protein
LKFDEKESVAEGHALLNAIFVSGMNPSGPSERAPAFGSFALVQVAFAGAWAQHFAPRRDLEALGRRFLSLNTFGTSHKSISYLTKRARNIENIAG